MAAYNLGRLEDQRDLTAARAAYRLAADSGHDQAAPPGLIGLGDVLINGGMSTAGGRPSNGRLGPVTLPRPGSPPSVWTN